MAIGFKFLCVATGTDVLFSENGAPVTLVSTNVVSNQNDEVAGLEVIVIRSWLFPAHSSFDITELSLKITKSCFWTLLIFNSTARNTKQSVYDIFTALTLYFVEFLLTDDFKYIVLNGKKLQTENFLVLS